MTAPNNADLIERAIIIALDVHRGQKDKHGAPYVLHPLRVGLRARNDLEMIAGFLHDVIEDSDGKISLIDLRDEGFPEEVIVIVDHLTKRTVDGVEEEWETYIDRVMEHEAAMHLKLLDLEQNMDTTRISSFGTNDSERFTRYVWAWHKIREKLGLE
ncbi:MAG: GTP pyrophosphokinase [Bacteroidota bacterium]|jgi:(p)ppGpp synthase/HD superfamily hydrolase